MLISTGKRDEPRGLQFLNVMFVNNAAKERVPDVPDGNDLYIVFLNSFITICVRG